VRPAAADAIVIGAGHNGLVAANLLADAGWEVLVLEAAPYPGGAVHSDDTLHPGFVTDHFSAFYPLGAASPVLAGLGLGDWGLTWTHAPTVLTHVLPDDRSVSLQRDVTATAASLDGFALGDGDRWQEMYADFERIREPLLQSLLRPFPPVLGGVRLLRRLGAADALRFARFAVLPVRRYAEENFTGEGAAVLLAGNALHTDLAPENAGSAVYGWLLCMLAQSVGFPVPVGGAGRLTAALVARLESRGGQVRLSSRVERVTTSGGRVTGVRLARGEQLTTTTVLADVAVPALYRDLVGLGALPPRLADDLDRFQWDAPTMKVNWALAGKIPWTAKEAHDAGTVHVGVDLDGLTRYAGDLATGQVPRQPFLLVGQMSTADASRSPDGTESAWAYTHLPAGRTLGPADLRTHVERVENLLERHAPGFRDLVLARGVQGPADLQGADANLTSGAVGGGTSALHQQLVFRPVPGLGRAETPIDGLYLAGAGAHPGGGVHGSAGANAARAALLRRGVTGALRRRAIDQLHRSIYREPGGRAPTPALTREGGSS
jgi:phytoene dehydrogenase-like protein